MAGYTYAHRYSEWGNGRVPEHRPWQQVHYTGDTDLAMTPPRIYRPHPGELWQSDCFSVGHTLSVFQRQSGITQSPCIDNVFLWYKLQHLLAGQVGALLVAQTYPDGLKRRGRTLLNSSVSDQDQFTRHAFRERWLVAQS